MEPNKVWPPPPKVKPPSQPLPRKIRYADFVSIALGCASLPVLFSYDYSPLVCAGLACGVIGTIIGFRQRDSFWGRLGLVLSASVPVWIGVGWLAIGLLYGPDWLRHAMDHSHY